MKNLKILVTGAGGFIGSHLVESLLSEGAEVTAFVRYNSRSDFGFLENINKKSEANLDIVQGDLRDQYSVNEVVKEKDIVFHLGALIAIPYSYQNPWDAFETNVRGTLNILTAVKEFGVKRLVHTSTSETYGSALYVPINESHPLQGQSPYSASKIAADKFAESFHLSYGTPISIIRPFNTYGPRQSARAVIPTIITQALIKGKVVLGSLSPTRDFTFVKDTVSGILMSSKEEKTIGEVINLGSNFEISIEDLAKKIISHIDPNIELVTSQKRKRPKKSEVNRLYSDNTKAKKVMGWEPNTDFDDGLKETIDWIKKNSDIYKTDSYII